MGLAQEIMDIFAPAKNKNTGKVKIAQEVNEQEQIDKARRPQEAVRHGPLTMKKVKDHYRRNPHSFADYIPFIEYLEESGTFLLDDCFSQAVVLSVSPIATEGRSIEQVEELRNALQAAFAQSFGVNNRETDWVLQTYSWKDDDLYRYIDDIYDSIDPEIRDTEFTTQFLNVMEDHFRGVNQPDGLFVDNQVTGKPWRGQIRRTYCVIYRRCSQREIHENSISPTSDINEVVERFTHMMHSTGAKLRRLDGESVFRWLTDWFNPNPAITGGDRELLYRSVGYPKRQEDKPYGFNLAESVLFSEPISDPDNSCWWFDDEPHTFMRFCRLNGRPEMGQLTGEVTKGAGKNTRSSCLMDSIPAGAMLLQTIIFVPSSRIDAHLQSLSSAEKGETQEAAKAKAALDEAMQNRSKGQECYYASQGIFVRGKDLDDLKSKCQRLKNNLITNGVIVFDYKHDPLCVEAYPLHLPAGFNPEQDKKRQYMQLAYAQHLANLSPIFGREQGSGNPGIIAWNRGGEPLTFDMFGKDRVRAAHGVVLGPQGSGKSAFLNYMAASTMAIHRPRMFILDKGGSFELLAEYFSRFGLTVNLMRINKNAKFSLCPFLDAGKIAIDMKSGVKPKPKSEEIEDEDDVDRDPLGEMEQSLHIMVTGGDIEQYKKLTQLDKSLMRASIIAAGLACNDKGRKTLTEDVRDAMLMIAEKNDERLPIDDEQRRRLRELAASLDMYCSGELDAKMFNSEGEEWPDADVTVLDVGVYGSDRYPAQLALAYIGYMQRVINKAEQTQYDSRDVVNLIDEAHLFTANPLLGYQIAFAIKVARKIGLWILLASQNVEDFSKGDDIKKILGLLEWWFLLNMEYKEVEDLCKYRNLTPEQKAMVLSCTKQPKAYTEAVVMGNPKVIGEMLTRQVPPSIFLALAMTDPDEKKQRSLLMEKHGLANHYDAACWMADELDKWRGLVKQPRDPNMPSRRQKREAMAA